MPLVDEMTPEETNELLRLREQHRHAKEGEVSDDDGFSGIGGFKRRTWALFSVMGGLIYGYNVSLAATLQYIQDDLHLTSTQEEALSATATLSDAVSMLVGGYLADRFGRKATAMFACSCSIVGALLAGIASSSYLWLVLWRLCSGVGNGLSILLIPMYISECVDAASRGAFLTLFQLGVNSGVAVPYLFMITMSENWRTCLACGSLPALYVLYNFHFHFPESIKWLRWKENPTDLEDGVTDVSDEDSVESVVLSVAIKRSRNGNYQRPSEQASTTPSSPPNRHLELLIGILLAYVNNCVDASLFYGPEIIAKTSSSYSRRDANIFGLLCSLVAVVSVIFAGRFVIARFSRRQVYLLCLAIVCICFVISGAIFARYSTDDFAHSSTASTSIMITFAVLNMFAAVGPSILFVVILSELFQDNSYRARYMSYCTFTMSLISLLVNGSMLTLFETLGTAATFFAYGGTYMACLVFFWAYLPETKQRQLV
ncbi:Sugar (and other) transporter [Phytophthora infestans]|uniref:Sugar (And other) transporter n=1 Tax=Phytophthora infestans TaxID=4787 RepID=A0A833ST17_PHYIN|nr:Sugar (and other) transporter [Phytophthora infestans]KAF4129415.1 Sugar (and other) transporter [Phytophthora infestans]